MSTADERIAKLEQKNEELQKLVVALKAELDQTEKRLDDIEAAQQGGGKGGKKGGKKNKGEGKKDKGGKKGGDGGDKKAADREKAMKAAKKEGGKKGQDLAGMHDMGGMAYFTVALEKADADWELMQAAMDGANKEVDANADDRKGGAGGLAKCFMSVDEKKFVLFLYHVPKALESKFSLKEWVDCMMNDTGVLGEVLEMTDTTAKCICKQNPDKELFPLKQRDAAINASFKELRSRQLIPEDDDSEDDLGAMYEENDIEW